MKRILHTIAFAAALLPLAWAVACESASPEGPAGNGPDSRNMVETQLSLSLKTRTGLPSTKMQDSITQADANTDYTVFRGIQQLFVIPFGATGTITAGDPRIGKNIELPHVGITATFGSDASDGLLTGLVTNNNSHLYRGVHLKSGTSSVLAYGQAIDQAVSASPSDSLDYKRRNGVLRSSGLTSSETPEDIIFRLEPYLNSTAESTLNSRIADVLTYMNSIANASATYYGTTQRFRTYSNTASRTDIANFFASFSNNGSIYNTDPGLMFSGGTNGLAVLLSDLYSSASTLRSGLATNNWGYRMCTAIMNAINNSTYVTMSGNTVSFKSTYANIPGSFGVPDGAVAIQWNGTEFVQASAASSALAPIGDYCYPPSLWYWTNSTLRTSNQDDIENEYKSTNPDWASILSHYTLGSAIRPGITSVAVVNPLQYGVAMLELEMKASHSTGGTSNLLDYQANTVSITGNVFPLLGIIVGEQRNLHFNFTPTTGTLYYVYDTDVLDGSTPKAYIRYTDTGFKKIHTLLVQTDFDEDVHYALEFRNDSGAAFYGANGCRVPAGGIFYLLGTLEISSMTELERNGIDCVFLQDHVTKVSATVTSLAKAYNVIPELRDPQLEIGVQTEMKWVGSTPANLPMY